MKNLNLSQTEGLENLNNNELKTHFKDFMNVVENEYSKGCSEVSEEILQEVGEVYAKEFESRGLEISMC